jgi:hypothetical protein
MSAVTQKDFDEFIERLRKSKPYDENHLALVDNASWVLVHMFADSLAKTKKIEDLEKQNNYFRNRIAQQDELLEAARSDVQALEQQAEAARHGYERGGR